VSVDNRVRSNFFSIISKVRPVSEDWMIVYSPVQVLLIHVDVNQVGIFLSQPFVEFIQVFMADQIVPDSQRWA